TGRRRGGTLRLMTGGAAAGRPSLYRQFAFTSMPIHKHCVVVAAARKYGLTAMASRTVVFGPPDAEFRKEHNSACKVSATYVASTWPDAVPREVLGAGRRVYQLIGYEHEWLQCPQGHVTGRAAVELP